MRREPRAPEHRVVIVGAGFGGLYTARALRRAPVRITLLDRHNHHTFQPLLYEVATAALSPADIAVPIRRVFRKQRNVEVLMAEVTGVDVAAKLVRTDGGDVAYDTLVIATGATHSYFGHDDWAPIAPGLKTVEDAVEMRRRMLIAFEAAERESDPARRRPWMTFVVVGAGATGVELAGALADVARGTLANDFRQIDPTQARIVLLEGAPRVLPSYPEELSAKAQRQLEHLGVEVHTRAVVTSLDRDGVWIGRERIQAKTVLWAAGVAASPLGRVLPAPLDRAGRVLVRPDLTVPGHDDVFVIGDLAAVRRDGAWVPGVAGAAVQEGRHTARNIERRLRGVPAEPFHYVDKGSLATIGRAAAVADFGWIKLSGFIAWILWFAVHIFFLIGFRNRIAVLLEWAWAYLTYERGARLITGETPRLPALSPAARLRPLPARRATVRARRALARASSARAGR